MGRVAERRVVVHVNVRNRNINTAFAGGRDRDRFVNDDFGLFRHRGCGFGLGLGCGNRFGRFDDDGFDRGDRDDRGDNIIVGNDIRTARDGI